MKLYKKLFYSIFFVLLLANSSKALTLSPGTVKIETEPDVTKSFTIKVYNDRKEKVVITPSVADIDFNKKGKKIYRNPGTSQFSVSRYINFDKSSFNLEAKSSKEVNFNITVPPGVAGGNQGIIFFKSATYIPPEERFQSRFTIGIKLGTTILQEDKSTSLVISKIKEAEVQINSGKPKVSLLVKNEGNTYINASATVAILGKDNSFWGTFRLNETFILKGKEAIIQGELSKALIPGEYTALITYQFRDKNITIRKPFVLK